MPPYKPPLRDFRFLLYEVFDAPRLYARAGFAEASPDVVDAILSEGAKFAENVLAPLNQIGDEHGSTWHVGQQGLSQGERALRGAVAYARERLQMRAASGPLFPHKPADPIIAHADVRRMLLTIKSLVEGCRALPRTRALAATLRAPASTLMAIADDGLTF